MPTSAEQGHRGTPDRESRLFIDLDACASGRCRQCELRCSYYHHPGNNGILSLAELAARSLVCRRCENPQCVSACPKQALERLPEKEGLLVRHGLRCVGCQTCSHACPYGTIYPENVPYLVHVCDFCLDRRQDPGEPLCVQDCPYGALRLVEPGETLPEETFPVGENLVVHATRWTREKA